MAAVTWVPVGKCVLKGQGIPGTRKPEGNAGKAEKMEEEAKRGKERSKEAPGSALQAGRQREAQAGAGAHVAYFGRSRRAWPPRRPPSRPQETSSEGRSQLDCEDVEHRVGRPGVFGS